MPYASIFSTRTTYTPPPRNGMRAPGWVGHVSPSLPAVVRPANMTTYVAGLINSILLRLNESSNTNAFNLESGVGTSAVVGITAAVLEYLNEGAADLARGCYPIAGTATYDGLPIGTSQIPLQSPYLSTGDASILWAARSVSWNGLPLKYCEHVHLEREFPSWATDPNGTPLYWWEEGGTLGIYPSPASAANLVVKGFVIPPPFAAVTDRPAWLEDDLAHLLVWYVCDQAARKNLEDPGLAEREQWGALYQDGKMKRLAWLWQTAPALARTFFPPVMTGR